MSELQKTLLENIERYARYGKNQNANSINLDVAYLFTKILDDSERIQHLINETEAEAEAEGKWISVDNPPAPFENDEGNDLFLEDLEKTIKMVEDLEKTIKMVKE